MNLHTRSYFIWADLFRAKKGEPEDAILLALKDSILFGGLTSAELDYVSRFVYPRVYEPKELVFGERERGFGLYVIAQGRVEIRTQTNSGKNVLVTTLEAGSFFGELALLEDDSIRTASATTLEKSLLIGFFKPDLMEVISRRPVVGNKILIQLATVLGKRLVETTERLECA